MSSRVPATTGSCSLAEFLRTHHYLRDVDAARWPSWLTRSPS